MTGSIDALVAHWADVTPDAPALVAAGATLSYRQLADDAAAWDCHLRHQGLRPGAVATVRLPREPRLVALLLGLLRGGAAYLAADPAWPADRVTAAADLAAGPLVVDRGDPLAGWHGSVCAVGRSAAPAHHHPAASAAELTASVFLTSGSTGRPKAVMSPHRAAVHVLTGQDYADFGPGCRMLQAAPMPWDGLTLELWGPLVNGGTVVLADPQTDPATLLRRHVQRDAVNTVWLTAALFHALVDDDPDSFTGLRHVLTGGERLSPDHAARFLRRHPAIRLSNGYGPCETTVFATVHAVDAADAAEGTDIPLGRPLRGVTLPTPTSGRIEEILIAGPGLAHGYHDDPRATAAAFVPAPHGQRWYRSGDVGALDGAGRLRFGGRADRQLKIRGQRLEPEELEGLLGATLPISAAAVTPLRGPRGEVTGTVAHVVPRDPVAGRDEAAAWVRRVRRASSTVPPDLRPGRVVVHPRLPLLPNGKIDYATLEAAAQPADAAPVRSPALRAQPRTELEHVLAAAGELGIPVRPHTDLFAAGLDSLAVVRLLARLHRHGPRSLTPADVYRNPTPIALAGVWADRRARPAPGRRPDAGRLPRAVTEMWLHEQLHPGDHGALVGCAFRVGARFDRARWAAAVRAVARRHASLGTVLDLDGDRVRRLPPTEAQLDLLAAGRAWPGVEREVPGGHVLDVGATALPPFDLAAELPWRWHLDDRTHTVLIVFHHVAIDGWSESIVLADLGRAYRDDPFGEPPPLEPADPTPAPGNYWAATLADAVRPRLPAPAVHSGSASRPAPPVVISCAELDRATGGHAGPARQHALLAAFGDALRGLGGDARRPAAGQRLVVGVAYSGRDDSCAGHVGLLVRILPIALDDRTDPAAAWLDAITHADELTLAEVTRHLGRPREGTASPFPVAFALHSRPPADLDLGWRARRVPVRLARPPFDVFVEAWPHRQRDLCVVVQHDADRVDTAWVHRLAAEIPPALQRIATCRDGSR